jgi:uncharacterized protein with GYD domain
MRQSRSKTRVISKDLADDVSSKIRKQCPGVLWKSSFATLGRFDVVDIVEADDPKQIEKAAMFIRAYGHSTTETLLATPWKEFLSTLWVGTEWCSCRQVWLGINLHSRREGELF